MDENVNPTLLESLPGYSIFTPSYNLQQIARNAWKISNPVQGLVIIQQDAQTAPQAEGVQQQQEDPRYRMRMSAGHELRELPEGTIIRGKEGATFAGYIPAQANKNKKKKDKEKEKQTQAAAVTPVAPCSTPAESPKSKSTSLPPMTSASAAAAVTAALALNAMVRNHQTAIRSPPGQPTQFVKRLSRKRKACKLQ